MILYDDKDALTAGVRMLVPAVNCSDDVTFKASYVVSSDLVCKGKVVALFDLIVFGDVKAEEVEVKGRFICMGQCNITGALIVHGDIWCESICAESVTCHDRIFAQSVDANNVIADGNIIIGRTLSIEELAETQQNVICGETAYGAGRIVASSVVTIEPIDLDEGIDAVESPFQYTTNQSNNSDVSTVDITKYITKNDYSNYLNELMQDSDSATQGRLHRYLKALKAVDLAYPEHITEFTDITLLLQMIEVSKSAFFKDWARISAWTDGICKHFRSMIEGELSGNSDAKPAINLLVGDSVLHTKYGKGKVLSVVTIDFQGDKSFIASVNFEKNGVMKFTLPDSLQYFTVLREKGSTAAGAKSIIHCNVSDYDEWLSYMQLIRQNKEYLGGSLYDYLYGELLGKLGIKPKFIDDRFKEKGWK